MSKLLRHYLRLLYYNFARFQPGMYSQMRSYFAGILQSEIEPYISLEEKVVLDVGGAEGEFCSVLSQQQGCFAVVLDRFLFTKDQKIPEHSWKWTVAGDARQLPFGSSTIDVVILRGILEHIPYLEKTDTLLEVKRVLKAHGIAYIMIPPWYSPHAGHDLRPFHMLPFGVAKFLKEVSMGFKKRINAHSLQQMCLYPMTYKSTEALLKRNGFHIEAALDTHLRMHFITKIPVLREILIPAVSFICRKGD